MSASSRALALAVVMSIAVAVPVSAKPGDIIVGDSAADTVVRVKPRTGAVRLISNDSRLVDPNDVAIGRDGTLYVADYGAFPAGNDGAVFAINPRNGNTRVVSDDELFERPDGIALGPDGDLYVSNLDGPLLRVRLPGGATSIASEDPLAVGSVGVVVPPDGLPLVGDFELIARVDLATGAAATVSDSTNGLEAGYGLALGTDGTIYTVESAAGLEAVNPRSGAVDDLSGPVSYGGYGIARDLRGRVLIQNTGEITTVNPRNGAIAPVASAGLNYPEGMEVEPPRCQGLTATIVGTHRRDVLKGSRFGDVIAGIGGRDKIRGKGGRDVICGGDGPDRISGGAGKDRCKGQAGRDRERGC